MQITDLNKIINLFLVGSLALTIAALLWMDKIQTYYKARQPAGEEGQFPTALIVLVITLLVLATAMLIGCVIDRLTEIIFRKHFNWLTKRKLLRRFFFVGNQYEETNSCRTKFSSLLSKSSKYQCINYKEEDCEIYAAALFFHTAKPGQISWLVQHHAVHILATDYIVLILILTIVVPVLYFLGLDIKVLPTYWWWLFFLHLTALLFIPRQAALHLRSRVSSCRVSLM
ncbi:MAG TPA: hypothetical protein VLB46_20960 [Pyrinomonadaceae bacterium]|nr:hypothetical protein [Pyrinomonadaceae bacterium]